jgi:hypothetical protein
MLTTLKGFLPEGDTSREQAAGTDGEPPHPYARLAYDDGEGAGAVGVSLQRVEPGSPAAREATACPGRALLAYDRCSTTRLADGSTLMLFQGYEHPDRRAETKRWSAELVTAKGHHVSVVEWNAEAEKGAPVTRPQPPLTVEELQKIAVAPVWRVLADVLPAPEPADDSAPPAPNTGDAIRETLAGLLPEGARVTAQGGQDTEYAYLVLDDGQGASMVQINVQPDMSAVEGELFGPDAETLPDGTKVTQRQGPGEKGGKGVVMWTVDTIRPGGGRVVVSAFNSGAQHTGATRDTPLLTMEQLRAIATDDAWRALL